jgi:hypothetical protein
MKRNLIIACGLLALLLSSCKKEKCPDDGYLIFGHFYGMCEGEQCVDKAQFTPLGREQFQKAQHLRASFPLELLQQSDTVIGQPDAGDWGGLYIEYHQDGVRKFWLIDKMKTNVPIQYHDFVDRVEAAVEALQ